MTYARKVDGNHALLRLAFQQMGCETLDIFRVGNNCPDILVGVCGVDQLVEVKMPGEDPTDGQKKFHAKWRGRTIRVARTVQDAALIVADMGERARKG